MDAKDPGPSGWIAAGARGVAALDRIADTLFASIRCRYGPWRIASPQSNAVASIWSQLALSARRRRFRQIHFQDRHVEGIGDFTILLVLEQHADKFAVDMHLDGIRLLGTLDDGDGVKEKQVA